MVYLVMGLPGTGKTYFAKRLARRIGVPHHNTDGVREEKGLMGKYDPESKEAVYQGLLDRMLEAVRRGEDVVIDGTFFKQSLRDRFIEAAEAEGAELRMIRMVADPEVVKERVSKEREDSEADLEVHEKLAERFEPIDREHETLDSGRESIEDMLRRIGVEAKGAE